MLPRRLRRQVSQYSPLFVLALLATSSLVQAGDPPISMNVANVGASSWSIDNQNNPPLTLLRGKTYAFVMQNVGAAHPFNINTSNTTGSANLYNDGVTNNGATGSQTLSFAVPGNAPDNLHYNCGNHASMNGPITIVTDALFASGFEPVVVAVP